MFFFVSKFFLFFLNPLVWILTGLVLALISHDRKVKKRALLLSVILLIVLSNPFLLNQFARQWDINSAPLAKNKIYSCAIVLGGFSSEADNGQGFFNGSADRFIQALKLKSTGKVSFLLITGGNSKMIPGQFRESIWVKDQLLQLKLPESSILIEPNSRNTFENAVYTKIALKRKHLEPPFLLITSAFHMRRSLYTFRRAGIQVIPYSSNFIAGKQKVTYNDFVPQAEVLNKWGGYFKELIGFGIYYVKG